MATPRVSRSSFTIFRLGLAAAESFWRTFSCGRRRGEMASEKPCSERSEASRVSGDADGWNGRSSIGTTWQFPSIRKWAQRRWTTGPPSGSRVRHWIGWAEMTESASIIYKRSLRHLAVIWGIAIVTLLLIRWFDSKAPAFHELLIPFYWITLLVTLAFTW